MFFSLVYRAEVGTIFALSWLITWYGYVLSDFRHVLRLDDFFLASHPLMAVYFAAVVRWIFSLFRQTSRPRCVLTFSVCVSTRKDIIALKSASCQKIY